MLDSALYPVFLKLRDRRVLLVGGGTVAASKLRALLDAGAIVTVVAPFVSRSIHAWQQASPHRVTIATRAFEIADLDDAWFVVAAGPPDVNRDVAREAEARRLFVNAVDDPSNASAYLGGVVRRDDVTIAISTDGRAPALAGLLREGVDALLPRDLDQWMARACALRTTWRQASIPMPDRRPLLLEALVDLYRQRAASGAGARASAEAPVAAANVEGHA